MYKINSFTDRGIMPLFVSESLEAAMSEFMRVSMLDDSPIMGLFDDNGELQCSSGSHLAFSSEED